MRRRVVEVAVGGEQGEPPADAKAGEQRVDGSELHASTVAFDESLGTVEVIVEVGGSTAALRSEAL